MFRNAVICTDLSSSSDGIVRCAEQLGILGISDAVLVHVIEIDRPGSLPGPDGDAIFSRQAEELERAGIIVRIDTAVGYAPYEIERIAVEHEAGLIVAGSHGKGLFDGVMSGSVSSDLIRIAERPILLTAPASEDHPEAVGGTCAAMLGNILFPASHDHACEHATRLMLGLAQRGPAAVTLLHVVEQGKAQEVSADEVHARLATFADQLRDAGAGEVRVRMLLGDAERLISQAAASGEFSLVVMGPSCEDGSETTLDNVTGAVLQKTTVPVLLAPPRWRP